MAVSPGPEQGQAHVAEDFLGAEAGQDLGVGIELHVVAACVAQGHLAAQVVQAVAHRVAMVALVAGGLAELVDHQRLGHVGRIAHAQVDDVDARAAFAVFQLVDLAEQVRRQALDAVGHVDLKRSRIGIGFALHGLVRLMGLSLPWLSPGISVAQCALLYRRVPDGTSMLYFS